MCATTLLVAISVVATLAMNLRAFQKAPNQPQQMLDEPA